MSLPGNTSARDPLIIPTMTEAEIAAAIAAGRETAATATGLDNPTLAFNLAGINDWMVALPFLDLTKTMRAWIGHLPGQWGGVSYGEISGYLDENGWPTAIPEGVESIGTIWAWSGRTSEHPEDFTGRYVLTHEGKGRIRLNLDAHVISSTPGRIVFENRTGGNINLRIFETDPEGTGDYIRNISVVKEENLALHEAGAIFNPDWLALIEDARVIRFMDWGKTNNSTLVSWDQRNRPEDAGIGRGAPVEYMVALSNQIGADPWFTMPHAADEDYVRRFATYVRDNLDPALTVRVEYSNEAWNYAFAQAKWLNEQSLAEWGTSNSTEYYTKMAVRNALIWKEVFGEEAEDRLVNVLATQTVNDWLTNRMLVAPTWKEKEPDAWVDPATVFDELAVTSYFGGFEVTDPETRSALIEAINDPGTDAFAWLHEKLMDPDYRWSVPFAADRMRAQAEVAESHGLKLVAYEGGQHVHHSFAVSGLTQADIDALTGFLGEFVRSEQMAALYQELWDVWAGISDGPFMQFGEASQPGRSGSWGLYSGLSDTNPRAELLVALNRSETPWWEDAGGGVQYQQGVTLFAGDEGEILVGTAKLDYLIGGAGDDIFIPGAGDDGINGGGGNDRVILSGAVADYEIVEEGGGYRLMGPDGVKYLVNIESLTFDDMPLITIADMIAGEAGEAPEPGDDDTEPGPGSITLGGEFVEAAPEGIVVLPGADGRGVIINVINTSSTLGREIGLRGSDDPSYVIHAKGASFESEGRTIGTNYWTLQENRLSQNGEQISDSALETARLLGSVAARAGAIHGTDGGDEFHGNGLESLFYGGAGNDQIFGGRGNDVFYGGGGDDRIWGGAGDDFIFGGTGNNILYGGAGNDTIAPGTGNDQIYGGEGFDRLLLEGDPGDYVLHRDGDGYRLNRGEETKFVKEIDEFAFFTPDGTENPAPDAIEVHSVLSLDDMIEQQGPASEDGAKLTAISGEWIDSTPSGISLEDLPDDGRGVLINGIDTGSALGRELGLRADNEHGSYAIHARGASFESEGRTIGTNYWTLQANRLSQNGEQISDSALETALQLGSVVTHTTVRGTDNGDEFHGHLRDDIFYGGAGNDQIFGGRGNDSLYGGDGNDRIWGGNGDDLIVGGRGNDILYGGAGNDTFRFAAGDGQDTIADFTAGDRLDLTDYLLPGQELSWNEDASGRLVATNGQDRITFTGLTLNDVSWIDTLL